MHTHVHVLVHREYLVEGPFYHALKTAVFPTVLSGVLEYKKRKMVPGKWLQTTEVT